MRDKSYVATVTIAMLCIIAIIVAIGAMGYLNNNAKDNAYNTYFLKAQIAKDAVDNLESFIQSGYYAQFNTPEAYQQWAYKFNDKFHIYSRTSGDAVNAGEEYLKYITPGTEDYNNTLALNQDFKNLAFHGINITNASNQADAQAIIERIYNPQPYNNTIYQQIIQPLIDSIGQLSTIKFANSSLGQADLGSNYNQKLQIAIDAAYDLRSDISSYYIGFPCVDSNKRRISVFNNKFYNFINLTNDVGFAAAQYFSWYDDKLEWNDQYEQFVSINMNNFQYVLGQCWNLSNSLDYVNPEQQYYTWIEMIGKLDSDYMIAFYF